MLIDVDIPNGDLIQEFKRRRLIGDFLYLYPSAFWDVVDDNDLIEECGDRGIEIANDDNIDSTHLLDKVVREIELLGDSFVCDTKERFDLTLKRFINEYSSRQIL